MAPVNRLDHPARRARAAHPVKAQALQSPADHRAGLAKALASVVHRVNSDRRANRREWRARLAIAAFPAEAHPFQVRRAQVHRERADRDRRVVAVQVHKAAAVPARAPKVEADQVLDRKAAVVRVLPRVVHQDRKVAAAAPAVTAHRGVAAQPAVGAELEVVPALAPAAVVLVEDQARVLAAADRAREVERDQAAVADLESNQGPAGAVKDQADQATAATQAAVPVLVQVLAREGVVPVQALLVPGLAQAEAVRAAAVAREAVVAKAVLVRATDREAVARARTIRGNQPKSMAALGPTTTGQCVSTSLKRPKPRHYLPA